MTDLTNLDVLADEVRRLSEANTAAHAALKNAAQVASDAIAALSKASSAYMDAAREYAGIGLAFRPGIVATPGDIQQYTDDANAAANRSWPNISLGMGVIR